MITWLINFLYVVVVSHDRFVCCCCFFFLKLPKLFFLVEKHKTNFKFSCHVRVNVNDSDHNGVVDRDRRESTTCPFSIYFLQFDDRQKPVAKIGQVNNSYKPVCIAPCSLELPSRAFYSVYLIYMISGRSLFWMS